MAGKPITRGSGRVAYALDRLTKNTLADVVIDRVLAEVGEDATDEEILHVVQNWLRPVQALRGDRPVILLDELKRLERSEAKYLERQLQERERVARENAEARKLADMVAEVNRERAKRPYTDRG